MESGVTRNTFNLRLHRCKIAVWPEQGSRCCGTRNRPGYRIPVWALAKAFPRQAVEEAAHVAGAREQRSRMLPAWLTVYFTLALALFMDMGAGRVMRKLAGVLAWAERGVMVVIPSEEGAV